MKALIEKTWSEKVSVEAKKNHPNLKTFFFFFFWFSRPEGDRPTD